jgi:hypothetical protein
MSTGRERAVLLISREPVAIISVAVISEKLPWFAVLIIWQPMKQQE